MIGRKIVFLLCITLIACNQKEKEKEKEKERISIENSKKENTGQEYKKDNDSCTYYLQHCKALDSTLLKTTNYDAQLAIKANNTFVKYALLCKNDSLSPHYLFKAAQLSQTLNKINFSEKYLKKIMNDYPKSKIVPAAKFLLAQYYADINLLNQPKKAKQLFNDIIKEYPQTIWAENASAALHWIGKTDEEMLKEIKNKNR